jgi:hypothetical protein
MGIETALFATAMVGAAVSAAGSIKGGMDAQKEARYQGEQLTQQASEEKQSAGQQVANQDYRADQVLGRVSANAGAAGVTQEGSVATVKANSESEAATNDMFTRYSGNLAALKDVYAAENLHWQGDQAKAASFVQAGQTLTSALTTAAQSKIGASTRGGTGTPTWGSLFNTD